MRNLLLFLFVSNICLYAIVTFSKTYGGTGDDIANSIKQTSDGGYIISGASQDSLNGVDYMTLLKTDCEGNEEWNRKIGGELSKGYSAIETSNRGFVITGYYNIPTEEMKYSGHMIYVEKTDAMGNTVWKYEQPCQVDEEWFEAYDVIQTQDGGYALTGSSYWSGWLLKLDSLGKEEWINKELGCNEGRQIIQTDDNCYAITGSCDMLQHDTWVSFVKVDSLCNYIDVKMYAGLFYDAHGYSMKNTHDKGFIIIGDTQQNAATNLGWLIKTDEHGEKEWDFLIGEQGSETESSTGTSVELTTDGGYILTGYTANLATWYADVWLIKADSLGNIIWKRTFGGEGDDRAYSVQQTLDGGYILAGYTDTFGAGGKDMWIIKTDENGTEIENPFLPQTTELHQNYPNPFNPSTEISYSLNTEGMVTLSVFNTKGELVSTLVNEKKTAGNHTINFKADGLNSGIYFYKLEVNGSSVGSKRMLLIK